MALNSAAVSAGDKAKATQYNNLRTDVTSHTHDGTDTARIPAVDTGWSEIYSAGAKLAWAYASADDPTFTFTIAGDWTGSLSAGMKIKLTQTTVKYFIITKVAYGSPNTTVTVYGGTDYDLANAAISAHYFSCSKAPQGFPLDPDKWTVETKDSSDRSQASPTNNTWYNLGTITIDVPIGIWRTYYTVNLKVADASANAEIWCTLSTANNSESDDEFTTKIRGLFTGPTYVGLESSVHCENRLNLATKDTFYLNAMSTGADDSIVFSGINHPTIIRAVCAFL